MFINFLFYVNMLFNEYRDFIVMKNYADYELCIKYF